MEQVVVNAASRLGFHVEQVRGGRAYAIDFGNEALVDSLPGVQGGTSFVGAFDREYAVANETIDFFASGHPLVEGVLAHFEEDPKGRVARLELRIPGPPGAGLVAVYKEGPSSRWPPSTPMGRRDRIGPPPSASVRSWREDEGGRLPPRTIGPPLVARLAPHLGSRRPHALAAVVVRS